VSPTLTSKTVAAGQVAFEAGQPDDLTAADLIR
jgi:hypothetical protein